jgi:hypothetical protein
MVDGERAKQRTYGIRFRARDMKDNSDKFEVGDKVRFALRNGKIEEGVVRAVILTTTGPVLNVSFGPKLDLAATVNARQIVQKLPLLN